MRSMTAGTIFTIAFLKGVIVTVLVKKGWWPDWEARARRRTEHKLVLRAYEQWRERAGPEAAADLSRRLAASSTRRRAGQ